MAKTYAGVEGVKWNKSFQTNDLFLDDNACAPSDVQRQRFAQQRPVIKSRPWRCRGGFVVRELPQLQPCNNGVHIQRVLLGLLFLLTSLVTDIVTVDKKRGDGVLFVGAKHLLSRSPTLRHLRTPLRPTLLNKLLGRLVYLIRLRSVWNLKLAKLTVTNLSV